VVGHGQFSRQRNDLGDSPGSHEATQLMELSLKPLRDLSTSIINLQLRLYE
jgi:hypothetical protein